MAHMSHQDQRRSTGGDFTAKGSRGENTRRDILTLGYLYPGIQVAHMMYIPQLTISLLIGLLIDYMCTVNSQIPIH